jgi:hypothetical protein
MPSQFIGADDAALLACPCAQENDVAHALAVNIAVSVWFARCPWGGADS